MTTHTIEIEGLPEGWEPVAYRHPEDEDQIFLNGEITKGKFVGKGYEHLIVQKSKPRRIVLEETWEVRQANPGEFITFLDGFIGQWNGELASSISYKIWRIKEE